MNLPQPKRLRSTKFKVIVLFGHDPFYDPSFRMDRMLIKAPILCCKGGEELLRGGGIGTSIASTGCIINADVS